MEWDDRSETLLKRVPFFVRKKVRNTVEEYAQALGVDTVTPEIVTAVKQQAMGGGKSSDRFSLIRRIENLPPDTQPVPLYQVECCRANEVDCPLSVAEGRNLETEMTQILEASHITEFLVDSIPGPLLPHHRFKVAIASCPNACSQVQVKDVGVIAQVMPVRTDGRCVQCNRCVEACPEECITLQGDADIELDSGVCLFCGQCIPACPTDKIARSSTGYALYIGGRLGRHPRLADKIGNLLPAAKLLDAFQQILTLFKQSAEPGERFSHWVERIGPPRVAESIGLCVSQ